MSTSARYMFYTAYLGRRLTGSQFQFNALTSQNAFDHALAMVLNVSPKLISSISSSRTDQGVHALCNAYGWDLHESLYERCIPKKYFGIIRKFPFDPSELTNAVNSILVSLHVDVRLLGSRIVSNGFCVRRHTKTRTYLYRLAVLKSDYSSVLGENCKHVELHAPLIESGQCWVLGSNFDLEKCRKAAEMFIGQNEFANFSSTKNDSFPQTTFRHMKYIGVENGRPLLDPKYDPISGCFDYYDIIVASKAFLFRQVRRIVGSLVAVAQGRLSLDDIQWLLRNPGQSNWNKYNVLQAPPYGLYLQNIKYDPKDFENPVPYYQMQIDEEDEEIDDSDNNNDEEKSKKDNVAQV